ncbi:MAG TPA: enoyl-CoA hydratase-related protein, partial [Bryobacteraceae bacterium]|nr:enoyl-CoA hydratase-related protein [Bryobacteraceae bacterium]
GTAYVTIANERKLNTLHSALMEEFIAAIQELAGDESLRAVVVTGAGERAFMGGADIDEMAVVAGPTEATAAGNVLVQAIGAGVVSGVAEAREIVKRSFPVEVFEPEG